MAFARSVKSEPGTKVIRTVCPLGCGVGCGVLAHVRDGVLIKVEPGDITGCSHICARGLSAIRLTYHPDRLKYPMKRAGARGEGRWLRVSWDEALDTIAANLNEISTKYGSRSLGWMFCQVGALGHSAILGFAGACEGTIVTTTGVGDAAGPCGDKACYGSAYWYGEEYTTRLENPGLCVVWGEFPAETAPV